jgi:hypothetical protein
MIGTTTTTIAIAIIMLNRECVVPLWPDDHGHAELEGDRPTRLLQPPTPQGRAL